MPRKLKGIRRRRDGWRVTVRVNGRLYTKQFPIDKPVAEMRAWRELQVTTFGGGRRRDGSLRADVETFLARPEIAAQSYVHQTAAHLALWIAALGGDRPRVDITRDEIEAVLQRWLRTLAAPTVYHRRSALLSLYTTLDGAGTPNLVKDTTCPPSWIPRDHSVPYATLAAIIAAMPAWSYPKKGIRRPAVARIVARVIVEVGIRPVDLQRIRRPDLSWDAATLRWPASGKGRGVAARTLPLTPKGLEALRDFDAANAYGAFNPEAVGHSFKRAARRVAGDDTPIHLYALRHSVGADLYRVTRDLATVGRMLGHAPGSAATAQYAQGANADVDRAAAAALSAARDVVPVPPADAEQTRKMTRVEKRPRVRQLRGAG